MLSNLDIARRWLEAITAQDRDALLKESHEAIEIHGPHGVSVGHSVVTYWLDVAPMHITIKSLADFGNHVLVHHQIDWFSAEGHITDSIDNAAEIEIRDGKVFSYRRTDA